MMRWITGSSVRLARIVTALAIAVVALMVAQMRSAPVDTYPEFLPPMVQVRTEALGLSAAEVEQLVTVPLEQDLLNGLPWLDEIRSESLTGLSSVDLVFEPGTDVLRAQADGPGAAVPGGRAAERGRPSRHGPAAVVDEPGAR